MLPEGTEWPFSVAFIDEEMIKKHMSKPASHHTAQNIASAFFTRTRVKGRERGREGRAATPTLAFPASSFKVKL